MTMNRTLPAPRRLLTGVILAAVLATPAMAQEMPPPRKMPRTPVSRETLDTKHDAAPASRTVTGSPTALDGEKLRVGETDVRLFGIVPPQLAASFGPQARAALDGMAGGQNVTCNIRDRDRDGRLLATCHTASGTDMALEMLKRGLAVTARGTLAGSDFSAPYLAAEQAAQAQRLGLWSISIPPVAKDVPKEPVKEPTQPAAQAPAAPPPPAPVADAAKDNKAQPAPAAPAPIAAVESISPAAQSRIDNMRWAEGDDRPGFFERYQILIAGVLMLGTALSISGTFLAQKRRDKRDETKAIAAALRGELMAGRSICLGRIKSIACEEDDRAASWPRLRATLYAAYVGRLGLLGAELARLISSIYGQASDYTALYASNNATAATPKKQALENLVKHIDDVLPRLAMIEQTGALAAAHTWRAPAPAPIQPAPQPVYASPAPVSAQTPSPPPQAPLPSAERYAPLAPAPVATAPASVQVAPPPAPKIQPSPQPAPQAAPKMETAIITPPPAAAPLPAYAVAQASPESLAASVAHAPQRMWEAVRTFIQDHRSSGDQQAYDPTISEYAAMIEADMARYQYGETLDTLEPPPAAPAKSSKSSRAG